MTGERLDIYQDRAKGWRWRLIAPNGRIIADSAEAYTRRSDALRGARRALGNKIMETK